MNDNKFDIAKNSVAATEISFATLSLECFSLLLLKYLTIHLTLNASMRQFLIYYMRYISCTFFPSCCATAFFSMHSHRHTQCIRMENLPSNNMLLRSQSSHKYTIDYSFIQSSFLSYPTEEWCEGSKNSWNVNEKKGETHWVEELLHSAVELNECTGNRAMSFVFFCDVLLEIQIQTRLTKKVYCTPVPLWTVGYLYLICLLWFYCLLLMFSCSWYFTSYRLKMACFEWMFRKWKMENE